MEHMEEYNDHIFDEVMNLDIFTGEFSKSFIDGFRIGQTPHKLIVSRGFSFLGAPAVGLTLELPNKSITGLDAAFIYGAATGFSKSHSVRRTQSELNLIEELRIEN